MMVRDWWLGNPSSSGRNTSPRRALHRGLKPVTEYGELVGGKVGDRPEVQPALAPAADVETLEGIRLRRAGLGGSGLRHEQVDHMQRAAVADSGGRAAVGVI